MQMLHFLWSEEGEVSLQLCSKCWVQDLHQIYTALYLTRVPMTGYLIFNKFPIYFNVQQLDVENYW